MVQNAARALSCVMGKKRHERQAASTRPAAKLGGGGGWNLNDRDPNDRTAVPVYPGASADATQPQPCPPKKDGASSKPAKRAFSGTGWRLAAPGFTDGVVGGEGQPPAKSREPKVLLGNLPCDVAPDVLQSLLIDKCDLHGDLIDVAVAVFGPARPKLRRDKKRLHRGFAVATYTSRDAAEVAAGLLNGAELHLESKINNENGTFRLIKASADVGAAMDFKFLMGTQGVDVVPGDAAGEDRDNDSTINPTSNKKKKAQHDMLNDPRLDPTHEAYDPPFSLSELCEFPMRHSCLATHTLVSDLESQLKKRFYRYVEDAIPHGLLPALSGAILIMERVAPRWTRVKELFESTEAFAVIVSFLAKAEKNSGKKIETFFDLACGHGFVGLLFACSFPGKKVRACDWVERPAFSAYSRVLGAISFCESNGGGKTFDAKAWLVENEAKIKHVFGDAANVTDSETKHASTIASFEPVSETPSTSKSSNKEDEKRLIRFLDENLPGSYLENVSFTRGDLISLRPEMNENSLVAALHGCNSSTKETVETAIEQKSAWCVMPCCVQKDLYMPNCVMQKLNDANRYAFLVGALAQKYDANLVRAIDAKITNRTLMVFGGLSRDGTRDGLPNDDQADNGTQNTERNEGPPSKESQKGPFTLPAFLAARVTPVGGVAALGETKGGEGHDTEMNQLLQ